MSAASERGRPGLVVDELVAAVGEPVHAVDAPAQRVRAHPEAERPLERDRMHGLLGEALLVAMQRRGGLGAQLALLVGVAEAVLRPGAVEQSEHVRRRPRW